MSEENRTAQGSASASTTVSASLSPAPPSSRYVLAFWFFQSSTASGPAPSSGWEVIVPPAASGSLTGMAVYGRRGDGTWTTFTGTTSTAVSSTVVLVEYDVAAGVTGQVWDRGAGGGMNVNGTTRSIDSGPTGFAGEVAIAATYTGAASNTFTVPTVGTWGEVLTASRFRIVDQPVPAAGGSAQADFSWGTATLARQVIVTLRAAAAVANTPPLVSAGTDRTVATGSGTVSITASASDAESAITYAWTRVSGPTVTLTGASSPTVQFTAPTSPGTLVLRCTVTDAGGLTASDDVTINVTAPGQVSRPVADISATGAVKVPSNASTFYELVDEADPSTTDTIRLPSGASVALGLSPLTPVADNNGWSLTVHLRTEAGTATYSARIRLRQAGVDIATRTVTSGLSTTSTPLTFALSSAEAAAIPNKGAPIELWLDNVTAA